MRNAAIAVGLFSAAPALAGEAYQIDPVHSSLLFGIGHLHVSKFWARFKNATGTLDFDQADPTKGSINFEIKADSIDTGDQKRDDHVKGPDFLNCKQFPTITFTSKSIKKTGDEEFAVTGDLTMHGVKKEVTLPVKHTGSGKDPMGNFRQGFETKLQIKRSDYGMGFMPDMLSDEIDVMMSIEAVKAQPKK
jgi:polyisoprenoid-binding protein YceI